MVKNIENYSLRFISAIIIAAIFISTIFYFRNFFEIILCLLSIGMIIEWVKMSQKHLPSIIFGICVILLSIISLFYISAQDQTGWLLLTYFCLIWTVDVMAMIGGKIIGGVKLAPSISPNKTVSGLLSGVLSATCIVMIIMALSSGSRQLLNVEYSYFIIYTMILATMAQVSDLLVSIFKRRFKIKDTGAIIPGHGGVLDRFDSIILTAPLLAYYLKILFQI